MDNPRLMRFLLVDDDDDHVKIILRTLMKEQLANLIDRVKDGVEAMQFLNREGKYQNAQVPDIIILDLKLPKKDGLEVLEEIRNNPSLSPIPIVILTTSDNEIDKLKAYKSHANSYLVKPLDSKAFRKMVEDLNLYWGIWNRTPKKEIKAP